MIPRSFIPRARSSVSKSVRARAVIQFQRLLLSPDRPRRGRKRPRVWHTWFTCELAACKWRRSVHTHAHAHAHRREPLVAFVRGDEWRRQACAGCFGRGSWRNCALEKTRRKEGEGEDFFLLLYSLPLPSPSIFSSIPLFPPHPPPHCLFVASGNKL